MKRAYPHSFQTKRAFQVAKRRELKALGKALDAARLGCAYMPGYPKQWVALEKAFDEIHKATRPGVWK